MQINGAVISEAGATLAANEACEVLCICQFVSNAADA